MGVAEDASPSGSSSDTTCIYIIRHAHEDAVDCSDVCEHWAGCNMDLGKGKFGRTSLQEWTMVAPLTMTLPLVTVAHFLLVRKWISRLLDNAREPINHPWVSTD